MKCVYNTYILITCMFHSFYSIVATSDLLFALMGICLRHRLCQFHLKLITAQRHLLVVVDQGKECVEHQVVSQVELGTTCLLTRVDTTVLHSA